MTPANIMAMAEQAGLLLFGTPDSWDTEAIERFAALVAAAEREACCEIAWNMASSDESAEVICDAIRARGTP